MADPGQLRRLYARLDTLHAFVYFRPESGLNFAALGYTGLDSYFASRSAPLGAVGAEAVVATFYNFNPEPIRKAVPTVWSTASPAEVLDTRMRSADQALRKMLGAAVDDEGTARAADLLQRVAESAQPHGRPLYAGNAGIGWPDEPHLRIFHAVTLLREYRGDAHVEALVLAGIGPVETLVLDVASDRSKLAAGLVQATRGWSDDEWAAGFASLRARGLLSDDDTVNEAGAALREELERRTDDASLGVWSALEETELDEVVALTDPLIATVGGQMFGG